MQDAINGIRELLDWAQHNEHILWWMAASSAVVLLGTVMLIPWIILRIPTDYFLRTRRRRSSSGDNPLLLVFLRIFRNVLGIILLVVGILLLVLPGQGVLTIFLAIVIADFPGKHRVVNWLVSHRSIHRPINWWRRKAGREPVELPRRA